jgi:NTE family protein
VVDGRLLADGGILDPLPIAPIAAANADITVAVSVSGMDVSEGSEIRPARERLNRLRRSTTALLDRLNAGAEPMYPVDESEGESVDDPLIDIVRDTPIPKLGGFAVMSRTIDIAQAALARHQMAAYPPDVLIEVPRTACRSLDFHRAAELIDLGHELAARALDRVDAEG